MNGDWMHPAIRESSTSPEKVATDAGDQILSLLVVL